LFEPLYITKDYVITAKIL